MIKVSIIIPVYNLEKYLERCLHSILEQTLKDIEIICINDDSTDNSQSILNDFAQKDTRIKLVSIQKSGQGIARNLGIEMAQGEYIGFIDGDDWIEPTMYEKLYKAAINNHSEMALCFPKCLNPKGEQVSYPYYDAEKKALKGKEHIATLQPSEIIKHLSSITVVCWNKIYKASFLRKTKAAFANTVIHEDIPFYYQTILYTNKLTVVRESLYKYSASREGSTTESIMSTEATMIGILENTEKSIDKKLQENIKIAQQFQRFKVSQILSFLLYAYGRPNVSTYRKLYFYAIGRKALLPVKWYLVRVLPMGHKIQLFFIKKNYWMAFRAVTLIEGFKFHLQNNPKDALHLIGFYLKSAPFHAKYFFKRLLGI